MPQSGRKQKRGDGEILVMFLRHRDLVSSTESWIGTGAEGEAPWMTARGHYIRMHPSARVAELVDAPDLGSGAERRESSSLSFRTRTAQKSRHSRLRLPTGRTILMQANLETLSSLERRLSVTLPLDKVNTEVASRLKRLASTVKLHGFRPGKVPMKIVEQQFGGQVRQEVLGDAVQRSFGEAVKEKNLRVAGYPRIEFKPGETPADTLEYIATFE